MNQNTNTLLVYGSPTPPGRIYSLLDFIKQKADECTDINCHFIQPKEIEGYSSYHYWDEKDLEKINEADSIIIASPVFRATIPAILKQLFDELPVKALYSKPVSLIAVGNVWSHYLGVERHICDILTWFGAVYVPTTFYKKAPDLNDGIDEKTKIDLSHLLQSNIEMAQALKKVEMKPIPIAKKYGR